jgi:gas vesicle protein
MNRLGATLLGGLLGAGAALLMAPRSGEETRRRLRDQADGLRTDARGRLSEGRMRATELIRSTQERANEVIERGQRELPETLTRSRQAVDEAANRAERQVDEGYQRAEASLERRPEETL